MNDNFTTYLHDHLAGARFATALLADLRDQELDADLASFAGDVLKEIEADRAVLEQILKRRDSQPSVVKEASAWITQKLGRAKFQIASDQFSMFEGLEILGLGILGKLSLWKALESVAGDYGSLRELDLERLAERARQQHAEVERRRIALARQLFGSRP